ncbi:MAG: hypothetical protein U1E66_10140 [Rhodospirillales bacterium]
MGSASEMLYRLERSLTVELQKRRADLLFVHAAVLSRWGRAYLFAAESGGGKSTLAWALLHHGFGYLSDELAPIEPETVRVHPYPHALCLKRRPPSPYGLPKAALDLGSTVHIPAHSLPGGVAAAPHPIAAVFFVRYAPHLPHPVLRPLKPAEAAARLYVSALNPLAHGDRGLAPTLRVAERSRAYAVATGELAATSRLILAAVDRDGAASC